MFPTIERGAIAWRAEPALVATNNLILEHIGPGHIDHVFTSDSCVGYINGCDKCINISSSSPSLGRNGIEVRWEMSSGL
jgi:hypothetical protein